MKIILSAILLALFFSSGRAHLSSNRDLEKMEEMLDEIEEIKIKLNQINKEDNFDYNLNCHCTECSKGGCGHDYHEDNSSFCDFDITFVWWWTEYSCEN